MKFKSRLSLMMLVLSLLLVSLVLVAGCDTGTADDGDEEITFPERGREVTIMPGYNPGGTMDGVARVLQVHLEEELGTTVVVENRPGSGNLEALITGLSRAHDGYTLNFSVGTDGPWTHWFLAPEQPPFMPDAYRIVAGIGNMPAQGLVSLKDKYEDFVDFVEDARARPGELVAGVQGPGKIDGAFWNDMVRVLDLDITVVHYPDASSVTADLLTGDIDVCTMGAGRQDFFDHPDYRVLTLFGHSLPDGYPLPFPMIVDFADELGFDAQDADTFWLDYGLHTVVVPADVPDAVVEALTDALRNVVANEEYQEAASVFWYATWTEPEEATRLYYDVFMPAMAEYTGKPMP